VRRRGRSWSVSVVGTALIWVLLALPARADTYLGPTCTPAQGPPGTIVRISHFPYPASCPSLRVFLSKTDGISSPADPRLIRLPGRVSEEPQCIGGTCGPGPLPKLPVFTMVLPMLEPGSYFVYFSCGSTFAEGADDAGPIVFTVEVLPPGATPPPVGALAPDTSTVVLLPASPRAPSDGRAILLVAGALGAALALRRTSRRRTDT
jgi:hypothetical protein